MAKFEVLDANDEVSNTIVADAEFMASSFPDGNYREVAAVEEIVAAVADTKITVLAFRQRFTTAEKTNMEIASIDNPIADMSVRLASASLRVYMADVAAATYVDLQDAKTRAGITTLEVMGVIGVGRASEILDAPIQQNELPTL